jgi:hypothetical protein
MIEEAKHRDPMTLPVPKMARLASNEALRPTRSLMLPAATTRAATTKSRA